MSVHSYSRVWLHLTWATLERRPLLFGPAAAQVSAFLSEYAPTKKIFVKLNYVNPEHVHVLLDLPTHMCVEELAQLLKGASSHWINEARLVPGRFGWGRGYGAFSVSHSAVGQVAKYIANQAEHHKKRSFAEELKRMVERYELRWHPE